MLFWIIEIFTGDKFLRYSSYDIDGFQVLELGVKFKNY